MSIIPIAFAVLAFVTILAVAAWGVHHDARRRELAAERRAAWAAPVPREVDVPSRYWLVGVTGELTGCAFLVGEQALSIGRALHSAIRLQSPDVSPLHCDVLAEEGGLRVMDRRSRYGISVNGAPVVTDLMRPGDLLDIGPARFVFRVTPA